MKEMWNNFCNMIPAAIRAFGGPLILVFLFFVLVFLFFVIIIAADMYNNYLDHAYPTGKQATITVEAK